MNQSADLKTRLFKKAQHRGRSAYSVSNVEVKLLKKSDSVEDIILLEKEGEIDLVYKSG